MPTLRLPNPNLSGPLGLWLLANALIFLPMPPPVRYPAALLLMLLPGWVWLNTLFGPPTNPLERLTVAVGLAMALSIHGVMLAVYLPGPLTATVLLLLFNGLTLTGLAVGLWQQAPALPAAPPLPRPWLIGLALLMLLAAGLRLINAGYAEFHEDEAEALMLAVRLLQGEDYALFLHRKGPAQMLLPLAVWLLTDRLTETLARLPFALSSLFSVLTLFLLGRRWFGPAAGLIAALLWAINGYAIGFARLVQYQALIFFLGPLALYVLHRATIDRHPRWLPLAALLLAAALLAHFDALLLLPAAAYLSWRFIKNFPRCWPAVILSLLLFAGLLAAFYIPFVRDPEFQNTAAYLSDSRVRPGLLYNNFDRLRRFDRDYSSHFYLPLLAGGLAAFLFSLFQPPRRQAMKIAPPQSPPLRGKLTPPPTGGRLGGGQTSYFQRISAAALLLLALSTFWLPRWWQVGSLNLAILPWLALGLLAFVRCSTPAARAALLLFGAPLLGYLFLVDDPRTHLYIIYPGAVLLAGAGYAHLLTRPRLRPIVLGGLALATLLVTLYLSAIFLTRESTYLALRDGWDDSLGEVVYNDLPRSREYFGYPKREGWKVLGALQAAGNLPTDYRTINEDFVIPIWYSFGRPRSCYNTPAVYLVRLADLDEAKAAPPPGYQLNGTITREGEPRLQIFLHDDVSTPDVSNEETPKNTLALADGQQYAVQDYSAAFDRLATPARFAAQNQPAQPVNAEFGRQILFTGYTLPTGPLAPGDTLIIDLHWLALGGNLPRYRAFVHLTDGATLWGQQDDDPVCRLPTPLWRSGQHSSGQFRLTIDPDTPPGQYPLIIGLYRADNLTRLPLTAGPGRPGDDFLWLGDITITAE